MKLTRCPRCRNCYLDTKGRCWDCEYDQSTQPEPTREEIVPPPAAGYTEAELRKAINTAWSMVAKIREEVDTGPEPGYESRLERQLKELQDHLSGSQMISAEDERQPPYIGGGLTGRGSR